MSILLYVAGAIVVAIGAALIGFGIPINEFSFGNTLIVAGTVAIVGGLIVLALGVVVRELQHLADMYGRAASARAPKTSDADSLPLPSRAAPAPGPAAARVPFPSKPKGPPQRVETAPRASAEPVVDEAHDDRPPFPMMPSKQAPKTSPMAAPFPAHLAPRPEEEVFGAPALPNPDEPPEFGPQEKAAEAPAAAEPRLFEARLPPLFLERDADGEESERGAADFASGRRGASPMAPPPAAADNPERSYFDSMWPADPQPFEPRGHEPGPAPVEPPEPVQAAAEPAETDLADETSADEPRAVPILKSGVVDGMGYTLYVDGSIEAELPQGTLRFASINELRAHLEKTS